MLDFITTNDADDEEKWNGMKDPEGCARLPKEDYDQDHFNILGNQKLWGGGSAS